MNVLKIGAFTILLLLSINFVRAAEDPNKSGFDPSGSRSPNYPSSTYYYGYNYGGSFNLSAQTPLTEKEREFKNLEEAFYKQFHEHFHISSFGSNPSIDEKIKMIKEETELKTWENKYREKFFTYFYCPDSQTPKAKKIDMIKDELKLKEAEDAYSKKHLKDFRFSQYGIETTYSTRSTSEKIKIIKEEMEFQDLLYSFVNESLDLPNISDAIITAQPGEVKAAQIEALKQELEIQRLIGELQLTYPDITDEYLQQQYSQFPTVDNGTLY